jgi:hypothetical protein
MIVDHAARLWLTGHQIASPSEVILMLMLPMLVLHVGAATCGHRMDSGSVTAHVVCSVGHYCLIRVHSQTFRHNGEVMFQTDSG